MLPVLVPFGWAASSYLYWVRGKRFDTLTEILEGPDPQSSPEAAFQTYEKTWEYEFPFLSRMAFHFGMLRAYAIPSIAQAISSKHDINTSTDTGMANVARRFEDTDLIVKEMTERPLTHPRAQQALERATRIRSLYRLTNEEYCYVLSVLVVEPCRLVEKWGYRSLAKKEKEAHYEVWKAIGTHMGIQNIPASFHDMEEFSRKFEEKHMGAHPSSSALASAAIDLFVDTLPLKSLHSIILPIARRTVHALMDPELRQALKISAPPFLLSWVADFMLRVHAGCVRYLLLPREEPARRTPEIAAGPTGRYVPVTHVYGDFYVHGYRVDELGPKGMQEPFTVMMDNAAGTSVQGRIRRALSLHTPRLSVPVSPAKRQKPVPDSAIEMDLSPRKKTEESFLRRRSSSNRLSFNGEDDLRRRQAVEDDDDDGPVLFRRYTWNEGIHAPVPRRPVVRGLFAESAEADAWASFGSKDT
ncbi:hypothetical protein SpCBS45565_g06047 [Spizellomyces sp. 'palustris']|nr:hypothetical protein SpCBS45565_g06047 [Spizellomyces sp. 'palustris']